MSSPTQTLTDEILDTVRAIVVEVIGEDYVEEIGVDLDTRFNEDLDIESIEFVAIGEKLQERYGDRVDFPGWVATLEVDEIIDMTVRRLVDHIVAAHG